MQLIIRPRSGLQWSNMFDCMANGSLSPSTRTSYEIQQEKLGWDTGNCFSVQGINSHFKVVDNIAGFKKKNHLTGVMVTLLFSYFLKEL